MATRDDELHTRQPSFFQLVEQTGPERFLFTRRDPSPEHLAIPILPDTGNQQEHFRDKSGAITNLAARGIHEEIGKRLLDRTVQKCRDLACRDPLQVGFGDGIHQGFLDAGILSKDLGLEGFLTKRL